MLKVWWHYITLHYIALHYTTVHYSTLKRHARCRAATPRPRSRPFIPAARAATSAGEPSAGLSFRVVVRAAPRVFESDGGDIIISSYYHHLGEEDPSDDQPTDAFRTGTRSIVIATAFRLDRSSE